MNQKVTVLIPLHHSMPFIEVVRQNIRELSSVTRIIVSDPFENDEVLNVLKSEFHGQQHLDFVGRREIASGWIPHYNDLQSRVRTRFFIWLAHDDEIDSTYIERCLKHLEEDSSLGGVVGEIESVQGEGFFEAPQPPFPQESVLSNYQFRANALLFEWNLGVLFRAVFRTKRTRPLVETFHQDHWADIVWAYGFCLENKVLQDPTAIYRKRFFADSTHAKWDHRLYLPASLPYLVQQIDTSGLRKADRVASRSELLHGISWTLLSPLMH